MKPRPLVVLSQCLPCGVRRRDVIHHDQLWMITDQGHAITVSIVDELDRITPRYVNTVFSQRQSAQNACDRLNQSFCTDRFQVRSVKFAD